MLIGVIRVLFETPTGLYAAAVIRLVFGVALFFAAPTSRAPRALRATLATMRRINIAVGSDGRARSLLSPFASL